jgi:hypothetical protein
MQWAGYVSIAGAAVHLIDAADWKAEYPVCTKLELRGMYSYRPRQ